MEPRESKDYGDLEFNGGGLIFYRSTKFSLDATRGKGKLNTDTDRIEKLVMKK